MIRFLTLYNEGREANFISSFFPEAPRHRRRVDLAGAGDKYKHGRRNDNGSRCMYGTSRRPTEKRKLC